MRLFYLAMTAAIAASACSETAAPLNFDYRPDEVAAWKLGDFDGAERVQCTAAGPEKDALERLVLAGMNPAATIKQVGSKSATFSDGEGFLGAVEITWKPGDPGVILRRTDYYIFDKECRVRFLGSGEEKPS
jgi:hypothetical protein